MSKVLYIAFDTEMTFLGKKGEAISIALSVVGGNDIFYAEFTGINYSKLDPWIKEYVVPGLSMTGFERYYDEANEGGTATTFVKDDFTNVSIHMNDWLDSMKGTKYNKIKFVSDVATHDFMHIVDIITNGGNAIELRTDVYPAITDINQLLDLPEVRTSLNIPEHMESFDVSRVELNAKCECITFGSDSNEHNALFDALIIENIFISICTILGIYIHE